MDALQDSPIIRWTARIFLLVIIILIIFWIIKRTKQKSEYVGIQIPPDSQTKPALFNTLTRWITGFVPQLGSSQSPSSQKSNGHKPVRYNKMEEKCRKIIEKIYKCPFPSARPDFLKSPRSHKNLELDCYNKNLQIALEYNGRQHYAYTPHFHNSKKKFYSQVHRDDWKRQRCRELGIRLIEVPYWIMDIDLESYIIKELKKKNCL